MTKKITALLLSLLMLCTVATAQTADYTGIWYLVSIEAGGVAMSPTDLGMEMIMTFNDDGTGLITMTDEEDKPATWALDGETLTVTAEDSPLDFKMSEDGQLVAEAGSNTMYFGREPAGPGFVAAAEIAAGDVADFDGTWNVTTVNAFGMVVPFSAMAAMGMEDAAVVIQNGIISALGTLEALEGALTDGKLVVAVAEDEDAAFSMSVSLLEDGTIALTYMEMIFYCEKVETAE